MFFTNACPSPNFSNSHGQLGSMSPNRQSFIAQPRAVPKLVDFPVEIISCGLATVVAMCARGHSDTDVQSPLQAQGGGGSPRTPIQSADTPMWLGDLPYWKVVLFFDRISRISHSPFKDGAQLNFSPKVNDLVRLPHLPLLPLDCVPSRRPFHRRFGRMKTL